MKVALNTITLTLFWNHISMNSCSCCYWDRRNIFLPFSNLKKIHVSTFFLIHSLQICFWCKKVIILISVIIIHLQIYWSNNKLKLYVSDRWMIHYKLFFVLIRNSDPVQYIIVGSYEEYISAILWLTDLMVEETQNRYNKLNGETPNYE